MNQWTLVNTRRSSLGIWLCLHALWLSQVGCGPSAQMAARTPPVPMVTVAEVTSERTIDFDDYVGRTEATETVSVRSRGYGYLKTVEFQDGQYVEEGQLLYSIESDDYEAAHAQSLAGIAVAESKAETAKAKVARNEQMVKVSAISREEYEESVAAVAEAEASITSAKATAVRTELDLKHTKIYAPISGQIDRTLVTPGNLVIGGLTDGTLLTRIVKTDPLYVYFEVDENSLLRYRRYRQKNPDEPLKPVSELDIECRMQLADETGFPHIGKLDFVENKLNSATGSIQVRGKFANPSRTVGAGMFVRVRVPASDEYDAVFVPERAIGSDQKLKYVYVIDQDNKAERRAIELGRAVGDRRVVRSGLTAGERVVVKGLQRVRPGEKVEIQSDPVASAK